ncbi:MAG: hypothetical protein ACFFD5_05530 [Candidatus Thorarchaeota archaeon]
MNDEKKDNKPDDQHPEILDIKEEEIPDQKPPNSKIIHHNLTKKRKKRK